MNINRADSPLLLDIEQFLQPVPSDMLQYTHDDDGSLVLLESFQAFQNMPLTRMALPRSDRYYVHWEELQKHFQQLNMGQCRAAGFNFGWNIVSQEVMLCLVNYTQHHYGKREMTGFLDTWIQKVAYTLKTEHPQTMSYFRQNWTEAVWKRSITIFPSEWDVMSKVLDESAESVCLRCFGPSSVVRLLVRHLGQKLPILNRTPTGLQNWPYFVNLCKDMQNIVRACIHIGTDITARDNQGVIPARQGLLHDSEFHPFGIRQAAATQRLRPDILQFPLHHGITRTTLKVYVSQCSMKSEISKAHPLTLFSLSGCLEKQARNQLKVC